MHQTGFKYNNHTNRLEDVVMLLFFSKVLAALKILRPANIFTT